MKKQLLLLAMAILPIFANASVEINGIYYNLTSEDCSAKVTYNSTKYYSGSIVIPQSVTYDGIEYCVTSIGSQAFKGCSGLTSINIPSSVTNIGSSAFQGCSGLKSITIPSSVTSIENYAFQNCSGLTSINIPNSVKSIEGYAFSDCRSLASITIPNSVTNIGNSAFSGTVWYNNQPDGLVYAGKVAYKYKGIMPSDTNIVLEDGTSGIAGSAFSGCSGLTSVIIPNSVTNIGAGAFSGCSGLTSVTIPNSVTSIDYSAFSGCSGLTSVTIPNSVTSIGSSAFLNCSGLTSVTIPNSVTSIGSSAFYNCSGLTSVTIPNSVTSIGDRAFADCSGLTEVNFNAANCIVMGADYPRVFSGCSSLTTLNIGNNVQIIPDYAFLGCSSLTSITIPNSVISIGRSTFQSCSGLASITIPNSVTSIGSSAFYNCSGLTSVTIPNSVTSIGSSAFYNCSGLTSVTIPNSVTSIGDRAFADCSGLTEVNFNAANCIVMGADYPRVFSGCSSLTTLNIGNNVQIIPDYAFLGCSSLTSITIPNSVISIGRSTFQSCSGLASITIPNSVTSIGSSAFYNCSGLTSVIIPNSVTSIGEYAFYNCSGLTSVTIPNSVTSIGWGAFRGCSGLTSITIPNSVTSIGQSAFFGCSGLTSITIPNSVTSIGSGAFSGCSGLTSVISEITEPFNCGTDAFPENACRNGTLYVPAGTKDLYIRFDGWRNFLHIEEGGEAAKYKLSFVVNNKELSTKNVEVGATIAPPSTDGEGNTITWYTYPATMPAHDLVVYGMVMKPEPAPAPTKYTLTYILDGQQYKQETIEEGAMVAKETEPSKEGYTFSGWQNEPTTMPAQNTTVTGRFTINSYRLSFIAENRELSSKNVTYGSSITAPTTDSEGNTVSWYTYPATMPAHDLVVYGMVVKQPEPEVLVWLTVKDGQGTTKMKVRKGTEQVLTITPEEGWKVVSVTLDGVDVTAQVKDGSSYPTPAITSDATLIVVYEQDAPSDVASARAGQATVKVVDDGVVIAHAEPQSHCVVYTSNGQHVVSTIIEGDSQKIRLQKGQVYILTINGRTLKFAL